MPRKHRGPAQVALAGDRVCVICPQPAAPKGNLCTTCRAELGHMLDPDWTGSVVDQLPASIPYYWEQLDPVPGSSGPASRRAPGFVSQPPCSLDAIVMRDPRSRPNAVAPVWFTLLPNGREDRARPHHEEDGQLRPVEVAVANVAWELWTAWGYHGPDLPNGDIAPGGVRGLCGWLHAHHDRVAAHRDVAAIHRFLAELLHQLRVECRDEPERPEGRCDAWLQRPRGERELCNGSVFRVAPRPDQDEEDVAAECDRCGKQFGKLQVYRMKKLAQQAADGGRKVDERLGRETSATGS